MRPPQTRRSPINLLSPETLRIVVINVTAALTSLLLIRVATLVAQSGDDARFAQTIQLITTPIVWPLRILPIFSANIGRDVLLADLVLIPVIFLSGLMVVGIISGWSEAASHSHHQVPGRQ